MIHQFLFPCPEAGAMQKQRSRPRRRSTMLSIHLLIVLCCVTLLFGCANPSSDATPVHPAPSGSNPTPTAQPVPTKADANETEAPLRQNLEKVQHIIDSMSLDQKLGQLIIVEY